MWEGGWVGECVCVWEGGCVYVDFFPPSAWESLWSWKIGEVDVLVLVGRRWGLGLGVSGGSEV